MNDVRGTVMCNSRMSGTPDLTLVFANPGIIEDCRCANEGDGGDTQL